MTRRVSIEGLDILVACCRAENHTVRMCVFNCRVNQREVPTHRPLTLPGPVDSEAHADHRCGVVHGVADTRGALDVRPVLECQGQDRTVAGYPGDPRIVV